jgi:hypothetical protein
MARPALLSFLTLLTTLAAGCFDPEIGHDLGCGPDHECPVGQRCENTSSTCVPEDLATPVELRFATQPAAAEALAAVPTVTLELLDADGQVVPLTGAPITLTLDAGPYDTLLSGAVTAFTTDGRVRFEDLGFDRPGKQIRLIAHARTLAATSQPFDVSPTRPVISAVTVPASAEACVEVAYTLTQAQRLPTDVLVEVDPDGPDGPGGFQRARQAASDPGKPGVQGFPGSPTGRMAQFAWSSSSDLPKTDAEVTLRFTPSAGGVRGEPVTTAPFPVRNGLRWTRHDEPAPGLAAMRVVDFDGDGWLDVLTAAGTKVTIHYGNDGGSLDADVGFVIRDLATGDFNSDGTLDFAAATDGGGVRLRFQRRSSAPLPPRPAWNGPAQVAQVAAEDLDHDGLVDLVFVDAAGALSVQRNTLASGFVAWAGPWDLGTTGRLVIVTGAHTGGTDILVGRVDGPVSVIREHRGELADPVVVPELLGAEVAGADLNGDGMADLVALGPGGLRVALGPTVVTLADVQGSVLALADVDRDGRTDVVVGDGQSVRVFRHVATAASVAFLPATIVDAAEDASAFALGDVDRDGRTDVVSASRSAGRYVTFLAETPRPCGGGSRLGGPAGGILGTLVELDADGKLDVVDVHGHWGGRGDGSFVETGPALPDLSQARDPQFADLDHDGAADIAYVSGNAEGFVELRFNDPLRPAQFDAPIQVATLPAPVQLALADVDQDQVPDLVVWNADTVEVHRGSPGKPRKFLAGTTYPAKLAACVPDGRCELEVADLDGDGLPELVLLSGGELAVLPADRADPGHFGEATLTTIGDLRLLAIGNLLGDAGAEILLAKDPTGVDPPSLVAYAFTAPTTVRAIWSAEIDDDVTGAALADVDRDGHGDLALQVANAVLLCTPDTLPPGARIPRDESLLLRDVSYERARIAFADVDADGDLDLLAGDGNVFLGRGGRVFATPVAVASLGLGTGRVALGQLTGGDALVDAVEVTATGTKLWLCNGYDTPPCTLHELPELAGTGAFQLQDLDGNGVDDLVAGFSGGDRVLMNPGFLQGADAPDLRCSAAGAEPRALGDLDGDGVADLVLVDGAQVEWVSDPSTTCSTPHPLFTLDVHPGFTSAVLVAVVDLNGDGRPDVLTLGTSLHVALQVPGAPGTFAPVESMPFTSYGVDAAVADFDRDGFPDLVLVHANGEVEILQTYVSVGELDVAPLPLRSAISARHIAVGDVDGNGWTDLVADDRVYLNDGMPGYLTLAYRTLASGTAWDAGNVRTDGTGHLIDFDFDGDLDYLVANPRLGLLVTAGE